MLRAVVSVLLFLAVEVPAAWYVADVEGTLSMDDVACPDLGWPMPRPAFRANGTSWDVVVENPADVELTFWGGQTILAVHPVRWDGRLEPAHETLTFQREFAPDYMGTTVPPGGHVVWIPGFDARPDTLYAMSLDGACGLGRV